MVQAINHIIVGFDDNEESMKALEWGASMVRAFPRAKLSVLHVFHEDYYEPVENSVVTPSPRFTTYSADGMFVDPTQVTPVSSELKQYQNETSTHSIIQSSIDKAQAKVRTFLQGQGVDHHFEILEGNAATSISDYINQHQADLIIVGNSGKSGLERLFLGSTSSKITKNANCSVLIAK
ncbi:universal stress protein [Peribacillus alkalitolerans]|uniref:universal stress protein n=1 Tax=Peribacillus alkalitolerans TaxID=1550385 RepID=UPI0013CF8818|nr:universal stress protein [Peribacillus alkalitolerans]